jgi:hypothetical protein
MLAQTRKQNINHTQQYTAIEQKERGLPKKPTT